MSNRDTGVRATAGQAHPEPAIWTSQRKEEQLKSSARGGNTSEDLTLHCSRSHNSGKKHPHRFDQQLQHKTTMAVNNVPLPPDVDWANVTQHIPSYEEVTKKIERWASGSAWPFAGMPRSMEPGYEKRRREAYDSTVDNIFNLQKALDLRASGVIMGHMWVQAAGFASRIKVGGQDFDPKKGAEHVLADLPAIIAGRYQQIQEREEGEKGMDELADLDAKFAEQAYRPSHEEIDMCRDHALEVEE